MPAIFESLKVRYRILFSDRAFLMSCLSGLIFVVLAAVATIFAKDFANQITGEPLGDLILDRIPKLYLYGFMVWGTLMIAASILAFTFFQPEHFPSFLKSVALLYFIRAIFIVLTHIPGYPKTIVPLDRVYEEYLAQLLFYGNDLFFSGHVSLPFLSALIFWRYRSFRYYLILATLISAAGVLLSRSHYSIDVFAAPFITFTIFEMAKFIFKRDFQYIETERKI